MAEMTAKQIRALTVEQIAVQLRRAAEFEREHKGITWEHGKDIVSIVAAHGDKLAEALEALATKPAAVAEDWNAAAWLDAAG